MRIVLTIPEIEALLAAAGNVDPCMFDEDHADDPKTAAKMRKAWDTGQDKLRLMLANRKKRPGL